MRCNMCGIIDLLGPLTSEEQAAVPDLTIFAESSSIWATNALLWLFLHV